MHRATRTATWTSDQQAEEKDTVEVEARATAELIPDEDLGLSGLADGGGYNGPFAFRQGKPTRYLFSAL